LTSTATTPSLPSTLERIGDDGGYNGPFNGCGFTCELQLPEKLKYIGFHAFYNCRNLYGELHLPSQLEYIGYGAFEECKNLTGSLEIPQSVTELYGQCFDGCNFNGTLTLHDGITVIGYRAFAYNSLKGELKLPKGLVMIGDDTFNSCDFSGELTIPASVVNIGKRAFANNWRLMGTVHFPEGLQSLQQLDTTITAYQQQLTITRFRSIKLLRKAKLLLYRLKGVGNDEARGQHLIMCHR